MREIFAADRALFSGESDAAIRLDIRVERRLGMLVGNPMTPQQAGAVTESHSSEAERKSIQRARALAAIPTTTFEEVLAEPKPSRAKVLARAIVSEIFAADRALFSDRLALRADPQKRRGW